MNKKEKEEIDTYIEDLLDSTENYIKKNYNKELVYSELLGEYLRKIGKEISDDYSSNIPIDFESANTDLKIKILQDAIDNNILLEQSSYYNDIFNDVSKSL